MTTTCGHDGAKPRSDGVTRCVFCEAEKVTGISSSEWRSRMATYGWIEYWADPESTDPSSARNTSNEIKTESVNTT